MIRRHVLLTILVGLCAVGSVSATLGLVNVTACGYGSYMCNGIYYPLRDVAISGSPVYVRNGALSGPGLVHMGRSWVLVFPAHSGLIGSRSSIASVQPSFPPASGWTPVNDFCCAPKLTYV
jgi:hypothetical protein